MSVMTRDALAAWVAAAMAQPTAFPPYRVGNPNSHERPSLEALVAEAVVHQEHSLLCRLLENGAPASGTVHLQDHVELPVLHHAAQLGALACVDLLVEHGGDIDHRDSRHSTALHYAAHAGHALVAGTLLKGGAQSNALDAQGWTPIRLAAMRGHRDVFTTLANAGAPILGILATNGTTMLHAASLGGNAIIVRLVLQAGVPVNHVDLSGDSALDCCGSAAVARALLRVGAVGRRGIPNQPTPIMHASMRVGHRMVVRTLLRCAANRHHAQAMLDATDSRGCTALHYAARFGVHDTAELLLQEGADVNRRTAQGHTPLSLVLQGGANLAPFMREGSNYLKCIHVLLEAGARMPQGATFAQDHVYGGSALVRAVLHSDTVEVERILQTQPDALSSDGESYSPVTWAALRGEEAALRLLLAQREGAASTGTYLPLASAARRGRFEVVRMLVEEYHCPMDAAGDDGRFVLAEAARGGHVQVLRYLLDRGANVEVGIGAPLRAAAEAERVPCLHLLLERGATVDAVDADGRNALICAALEEREESIAVLVAWTYPKKRGGAAAGSSVLTHPKRARIATDEEEGRV